MCFIIWPNKTIFPTGLVEEDSPYGKAGDKGTYFFEFSRPLRTMDRFQQVSRCHNNLDFVIHFIFSVHEIIVNGVTITCALLVTGCSIHNWSAQQCSCCLLVSDCWESLGEFWSLFSQLQLASFGHCISFCSIHLSRIIKWLMGCCNCFRSATLCSLLMCCNFCRIPCFQNQSCAFHTHRSSITRNYLGGWLFGKHYFDLGFLLIWR